MMPPLTTDRQRYHTLYALVCEDFPVGTVDTMLRNRHEATASQLTMVRNGRKPHLRWLIEMIEQAIPQFEIPAQLRASQVVAPLLLE